MNVSKVLWNSKVQFKHYWLLNNTTTEQEPQNFGLDPTYSFTKMACDPSPILAQRGLPAAPAELGLSHALPCFWCREATGRLQTSVWSVPLIPSSCNRCWQLYSSCFILLYYRWPWDYNPFLLDCRSAAALRQQTSRSRQSGKAWTWPSLKQNRLYLGTESDCDLVWGRTGVGWE